ncbi:type IV secretion protein Rhs, partial [Propionibacterium australiense]
MVTQKGTLEGAITDFADKCSWCKINTSGITTALASFETNNANEVRWVDTVAAAFEAAGGSGTVSSLSDVTLAECLAAAGVAETRRPLDVTAPSIQGDPQTSGYADDPVNTTTGNFVEPETDLSFTGGAASLVFSRMYNSLSQVVGSFGPGWASSADERLTVDGEGAVWVQASGRHVVFPRLADGWDRADGDSFWLVRDGETGSLVVSDNAGGRWCFDRAGRPAWSSRGAGTRVDYEWAGGRLVGLWHEWGRGIRLEWDPDGSRVVALVASDGRRVDYAYDGSGRLTAAVSDGGATRTYVWNEQGLICRVTDPDGVVEVENTYNRLGQVTSQRSAFGRVSHYSYLPGGVTQVA